MKEELRRMIVTHIDTRGEHALLFGDGYAAYYVISRPEDGVQKGDCIEYEPYGFDFGWFVRKIEGGK